MTRNRQRAALATTVAALGLSLGFAATSQAKTTKPPAKKPTTVTACVKNKTGATTVLLGSKAKKKCPKGSTKVTWNIAGKNGANGVNGKNGVNGINGTNGASGSNGQPLGVRDATGKSLGLFAGFASLGLPIYQVLVDGGLYYYLPSGQLFPVPLLLGLSSSSYSPLFLDAACAGTAYAAAPDADSATFLQSFLGGAARFVFRTGAGSSGPLPTTTFDLGPASAWKLTTTHSPATAAATWTLDDTTGACEASGSTFTGELIALASVPAPPDGVGPLSVG